MYGMTFLVKTDGWQQAAKRGIELGAMSKSRNCKARDVQMAVEVTKNHGRERERNSKQGGEAVSEEGSL